jgi:hypothetical protein
MKIENQIGRGTPLAARWFLMSVFILSMQLLHLNSAGILTGAPSWGSCVGAFGKVCAHSIARAKKFVQITFMGRSRAGDRTRIERIGRIQADLYPFYPPNPLDPRSIRRLMKVG